MPLQPGDQVPELTLPSHTREQISLSDFRGRPLVVHFFPLAFSSTCTEQICTTGEDLGIYREMDAEVVAISVDSPYALARFREDCGAEFPFLSDFHRDASAAFGVLREAPLGPGLRNTSDRAVFVIDAGGTVSYTWHSTNPSLLPPFEEIKAAVRAI
jgi:peroxiredoxin